MRVCGFALAILAAAALLACGEDPVPKLEAERQGLLDGWRPKAEFWSAVERKGTLLKEKRAAEKELEEIPAKLAALEAERAQQDASLASARDANVQTSAALAGNRSELARIEGEVAKREAALAGFERRRIEAPAP
jgi:septal ring factor EnvC (AmiA/AmiB activator)